MDDKLIQEAHTQTREALNDVHRRRKTTLFFQKIMWLITGVYFILMLLVLVTNYFPNSIIGDLTILKFFQANNTNPYANLYPIIGLIVLLYPTTYFFANQFRKFKLKESETISRMVKILFPNVDFAQNTKAPDKIVVKSKLFAWVKKGSPIHSFGQIRRKTNDTEVNIADIGIIEGNVSNKLLNTLMQIPGINMLVILYQYVIKNIVSNKSTENNYYTYRGMFCWMSFKKKLSGHTVILPKNYSTKIDRLASFNFKEEEEIYLEDPRFTDEFIVYSTDQVEARYVLTSSLMERIVALKERFNQPILLSFQNQQLFLAVKNDNGLFSFAPGKIDALNTIEELANDIETALEITSELKLK